MKYTHPDKDSEVIEPLVSEMNGDIGQMVVRRPLEMSDGFTPLYQSVTDEVQLFTWDIEQLETSRSGHDFRRSLN